MAIQFDLEKILTIVRDGNFDELVGAVEGDKLECKGSPYRLDDEHERFELAKDVTSFAMLTEELFCSVCKQSRTIRIRLTSLGRSEHSRSLM
jgi:hypothetical protein